MKYYFFEYEIGEKYQERYRNLLNIFSIQKLFYDHDHCLEEPMLSRPFNIDLIELDDNEIYQCRVEADKQIS